MTQSLWYLRHEGQIFGPFPPPQIEEALKTGEVSPDWDISLNETDWLSIAESGQFKLDREQPDNAQENVSWRDQRQQARKRWLQEGASFTEAPHDPALDAAARNSIARDHIRTQVLLQEEKNKRASPWVVLLALGLIAGVGVTVWIGQHDKPIQTGINQAASCNAPLNEGVNWSGCAKHAFSQPAARARNARMDKAQLDDARLKGADLAYASFKNASLRNVEFANVNLTGADLTGADLSGADLTAADLRYAVLTAANLTGVRFSATQIDKATWVDGRVCAAGSVDVCR